MKNFISVHDVADIDALVQQAIAYKADPYNDGQLGKHKSVGLLLFNPSMRTRLSTQIAARNLGMEVILYNIDKEGWKLEMEDGAVMNGTSLEHIRDAAPVLGAYFDVLCVRSFPGLTNRDEDYEERFLMKLMQYAGIPVISLESATLHPLQSLTDIMTITEEFKEVRKPRIVLTWAPHVKAIPQCVANSFAQWVNAWDKADFVIAHPKGYELAEEFSGNATIVHNQEEALRDADFVYVKNWSAYHDYGSVLTDDPTWMLTKKHLTATNNARVMHCLPVRRNVELSDEVLDSDNSIVSKQAANRVFAAQAVLSQIIKTQSN